MAQHIPNIQVNETSYRGITKYSYSAWSIKAYKIERKRIKNEGFKELGIKGHSIYFLYGEDDDGRYKIYVGRSSETETNVPLFTRLSQHNNSTTEHYRDKWDSVVAISFDNLSFDEMRNLENYFFKALLPEVKLNRTKPDTGPYKYENIKYNVEYIKDFVTFILKENVFKEQKRQEEPKEVPRLVYTDTELENQGKRLVDKQFETITEVQTPNDIIEKILDLLPPEIWNPTTKFLDPACKSGEFLKAIFNRLMVSPLYKKEDYPNDVVKSLYIMSEQLYGIALTETSYTQSYKNLYKNVNVKKIENFTEIIDKFNVINNLTKQLQDVEKLKRKKSINNKIQEHREELATLGVTENTLKEFLRNKFGEGKDMTFDVVIGNPPYQENTGSGLNESGAAPLFDKFIVSSINIAENMVCLVTPSKWMSGNQSNYVNTRNMLVADGHLKKMVDYFNPQDLFPNLQIAGGVSYFLYDKGYTGDCEFTTIMNTEKANINYTSNRKLNKTGIIPRHAIAEDIIRKIGIVDALSNYMYKGLWKLPTDFIGKNKKVNASDIKVVTPRGDYYIDVDSVNKMHVDSYKVMFTRVVNGSTFLTNSSKALLSSIRILEPGEICNASYMVVAGINKKEYAENIAMYLKTKFVRYLLLQALFGIGLTADRFQYVPVLDFTQQWTDDKLYQKYSLTPEEIQFIENIIRPLDDESNYTIQDAAAAHVTKLLNNQ